MLRVGSFLVYIYNKAELDFLESLMPEQPAHSTRLLFKSISGAMGFGDESGLKQPKQPRRVTGSIV